MRENLIKQKEKKTSLSSYYKIMTLEKIVYTLALLSVLFVFSTSFAYGLLTIDEINIPSSINENDVLYMSMSATTDTNNNITYSIYRNGNLISNDDSYSMLVAYSMQGINNFTFTVYDGVDTVSELRQVNVVDVPLTVSINSPQSQTYNNYSISVSVSTNIDVNTCTYNTNNSLSGSLSGSGKNYAGIILFSQDGTYILSVNCTNAIESKTSNIQFSIDTINPVITSKSSIVNSDGTVSFTLSTDKVSICKYSTNNVDYNSMTNTFTSTNNVLHHTTTSILADGNYIYYFKCKSSTTNNYANTESLSFNVVIKPRASIDIESVGSDTPLKAGTYVVKLTSSETLASAPTLYYNFNTDQTQRFVTLTGSGTSWNGYMIINSDTPNVVGTFYYSGVDMSGNIGNQITSGQLFLVDTTAPTAPISVEAESQSNGYIKLKWYYDGEEVDKYNIYRTVSGDPQYVDYIDTVSTKQYMDEDTIEGVTYYYRVAAVDDAGNDGYLSEAMQATSIRLRSDNTLKTNTQSTTQPTTVPVEQEFLSVELASKVDQLIIILEEHQLDIDNAKKDLDSVSDPVKLKIIEILDLQEKILEAKSGISNTVSEAKSLKLKQSSQSELDMKLNKLRMDGIKYKSMVAEDIVVNEQSSFKQLTQSLDVENAIREIVDSALSKKLFNEYLSKNKQLQDLITVDTEVIIFKIKYLEKDDYDKHTLVKKTVSSKTDLKDIVIIETIPKSFERDAKDINFNLEKQSQPIVVKSDPVVKWELDAFNNYELYYMINNHAEMSAAKDTKTIALIKPEFTLSQTESDDSNSDDSNLITGFSLFDIGDMKFETMHLIIFIGILSIIGLSLYYVSLDRKEKELLSKHDHSNDFDKNSDMKSNLDVHKNSNKHNHSISHNSNNYTNYIETYNPNETNSSFRVDITKTSSKKHLSKNPESNLDFNDMSRRLDAANLLINSFDYEKSRQIYNSCIEFYKKHHFKSISEKEDFKIMLDHLYIKLLAYRLVHVSRKSSKDVMQKNSVILDSICLKLYHSINDVAEEYRLDEKKFIDYLYNSTSHLKKIAS